MDFLILRPLSPKNGYHFFEGGGGGCGGGGPKVFAQKAPSNGRHRYRRTPIVTKSSPDHGPRVPGGCPKSVIFTQTMPASKPLNPHFPQTHPQMSLLVRDPLSRVVLEERRGGSPPPMVPQGSLPKAGRKFYCLRQCTSKRG